LSCDLRPRRIKAFKDLQDRKVCFEVCLCTGEKMLLPTTVALNVACPICLLEHQAEEAKRCAAAGDYLGQVSLHVVLNLTI